MFEADPKVSYSQLPSKVDNNIYLGGFLCSEYEHNLKDLGVTHILVASSTLEIHFPEKFEYLRLNLIDDDEEDILQYFEMVYDFLESCFAKGGKVLIHCAAGVSRSGACTVSYFMKKYKLTTEKALELVKIGRRCVEPNKGFMIQLKKWEKLVQEVESKVLEIKGISEAENDS